MKVSFGYKFFDNVLIAYLKKGDIIEDFIKINSNSSICLEVKNTTIVICFQENGIEKEWFFNLGEVDFAKKCLNELSLSIIDHYKNSKKLSNIEIKNN